MRRNEGCIGHRIPLTQPCVWLSYKAYMQHTFMYSYFFLSRRGDIAGVISSCKPTHSITETTLCSYICERFIKMWYIERYPCWEDAWLCVWFLLIIISLLSCINWKGSLVWMLRWGHYGITRDHCGSTKADLISRSSPGPALINEHLIEFSLQLLFAHTSLYIREEFRTNSTQTNL